MTDETADSFDHAHSAIDRLVDDPITPRLVQVFYDPATASEHSSRADFAGELFTTLGVNDPLHINADDIVAVHLLGMTFGPTATEALLSDENARRDVSELLGRIPTDCDIWDASEKDLDAANELWQLLRHDRKTVYRRIDYVISGKLLARKRPRLIPIVDRTVEALLPMQEPRYWELFRTYLTDEDRRTHVERLRPNGLSRQTVPTLRLLDTAIWMHGSEGPAAAVRETIQADV